MKLIDIKPHQRGAPKGHSGTTRPKRNNGEPLHITSNECPNCHSKDIDVVDQKHLKSLENVRVTKEEIELLQDVRDKREIAQYSVTKRTTIQIAESTKAEAREFVDYVEEIFELL